MAGFTAPLQHTVALPSGERFAFAWVQPKEIEVYLRGFKAPIDTITFTRPIFKARFAKEIHRWIEDYRYRKHLDPLRRLA